MSSDAACILVVEAVAYIGWYIWDLFRQARDDDNNPFDGPFDGWGW